MAILTTFIAEIAAKYGAPVYLQTHKYKWIKHTYKSIRNWTLHWYNYPVISSCGNRTGIPQRIQFKLCLLMYKALQGMVPDYLRELCWSVSEDDARGSLRSVKHGDLIVPRAAIKFGDRAFTISGPLMWNSLPMTVRNSSTLSNFKSALKSHLFTWLFSRLHQQLRSVTAPLNRFYVLWCHRNHRCIIIIKGFPCFDSFIPINIVWAAVNESNSLLCGS